MKFYPKKLLSLLLAGLLLVSSTACAAENDDPKETTDTSVTEAATEADTGYKPDIDVKDYDCEFVITGVDDIRNWALSEEDKAGDPLEDAFTAFCQHIIEHDETISG